SRRDRQPTGSCRPGTHRKPGRQSAAATTGLAMTTQYTPYETQPPLPDPEPRRSSATKPLMILLAVIGGITLVVILTTSAMSSLVGLSGGSATRTADTTNVTDLEFLSAGASFYLDFADVHEATRETSSSRANAWELTSQNSTLVVY